MMCLALTTGRLLESAGEMQPACGSVWFMLMEAAPPERVFVGIEALGDGHTSGYVPGRKPKIMAENRPGHRVVEAGQLRISGGSAAMPSATARPLRKPGSSDHAKKGARGALSLFPIG
jgi:hypothetical protein